MNHEALAQINNNTLWTQDEQIWKVVFKAVADNQLDVLQVLLGFPEEHQYQALKIQQEALYVQRAQLELALRILSLRQEAISEFKAIPIEQIESSEQTDPANLRNYLTALFERNDQKAIQKTKDFILDFLKASKGFYRQIDKQTFEFVILYDFDKRNSSDNKHPVIPEHFNEFAARCFVSFDNFMANIGRLQYDSLDAMDLKGLEGIYQQVHNQVQAELDGLTKAYRDLQEDLAKVKEARDLGFQQRQDIVKQHVEKLPAVYWNLNKKNEQVVLRQFILANVTDEQDNTLLHQAINSLPDQATDCLSFLLKAHKLDPLVKNKNGETPLATAFRLSKPKQVALILATIRENFFNFDKYKDEQSEVAKSMQKLETVKTILDSYGKKLEQRHETYSKWFGIFSHHYWFFSKRNKEYNSYLQTFQRSLDKNDPFPLVDEIQANSVYWWWFQRGLLGKSELHDNLNKFSLAFTQEVVREKFYEQRDRSLVEYHTTHIKNKLKGTRKQLKTTEDQLQISQTQLQGTENTLVEVRKELQDVKIEKNVLAVRVFEGEKALMLVRDQDKLSLAKQLVEKDNQLTEKDKQLTEKDNQLTKKDKQIIDYKSEISGQNGKIEALEKQVVEKSAKLEDHDTKLKTQESTLTQVLASLAVLQAELNKVKNKDKESTDRTPASPRLFGS